MQLQYCQTVTGRIRMSQTNVCANGTRVVNGPQFEARTRPELEIWF